MERKIRTSMYRAHSTAIFCLSLGIGAVLPFIFDITRYTIVLSSLIIAIVFFVLLMRESRTSSLYLPLFCVALGIAIGMYRGVDVRNPSVSSLDIYKDKTVTIVGRISEYPDKRDGHTLLTVGSINILGNSLQEKILVRNMAGTEYVYGEEVVVTGKIERPAHAISMEDGSRFSYNRYLYKDDIFYTIPFATIVHSAPPQTSLTGVLYAFKDICIEGVEKYIREPMSGLLVGILFGVKRALGAELYQVFIITGLVHLVVLSGYNIGLVVSGTLRGLSRLERRTKLSATLVTVCIFIVFVGGGAAVARAGIMATIALIAREQGVKAHVAGVLSIAFAVLTYINPRDVLYDPGFALSFLATIGIVFLTDYFFKFLSRVPKKFLMRETLASSLAVIVTTTPYMMWYMSKVSLISVISNLIVAPFVPIIMILGGLYLVCFFVFEYSALVVSYILSLLLYGMIWFAETFSRIPYAQISVSIPTSVMILLYIAIFVGYMRLKSSG